MWRILSFSLALTCAFTVPARALECPNSPPPQITLNRIEDPVQYDFSRNRVMLNQMGSQMLASRNTIGSNSYVGGLTNGTISSDMSTQVQTLTSSDGSACVWISDVTIRLHYVPVVYISREFVQGTCYHAAVLEHEHKHVATDLSLLDAFSPQLRESIGTVALNGRVGPFPIGQMQAVSANINKMMEAKLNEAMNGFSQVRQARQAQVDMPQEYARVQSLCQNWP